MSEFHAAADVTRKNALDSLHQEFDGLHSPEQVDDLFADSLEQIRQVSKVGSYLGTLAARLARERLRALAQSEGKLAKPESEVLFVAVHDGGRGQMAAALMRFYASGAVNVSSAASGDL